MSQYSEGMENILLDVEELYKSGSVEVESIERIPKVQADYPLVGNKWLKIDNVTCVFLDMKNSTQLSAQKHDKSTAGIYELFTGTAVKILNHYGASYIDVRGDGAFGLFDFDQVHHAIAAAVTFKTFTTYELPKLIGIKDIVITSHIGLDRKTVLVKRIGIKTRDDKTNRENEVWAGKPVNMAAKLSSIGKENQLLISERVHTELLKAGSPHSLRTCGCPGGQIFSLWYEIDLTNDERFDFNKAYSLNSGGWCGIHGEGYCAKILEADSND